MYFQHAYPGAISLTRVPAKFKPTAVALHFTGFGKPGQLLASSLYSYVYCQGWEEFWGSLHLLVCTKAFILTCQQMEFLLVVSVHEKIQA